jgi:hypothetical protein
MKHLIAIPELAQRLGVDARTAEELARDVGAPSWTEEMGLCGSAGQGSDGTTLNDRCPNGHAIGRAFTLIGFVCHARIRLRARISTFASRTAAALDGALP